MSEPHWRGSLVHTTSFTSIRQRTKQKRKHKDVIILGSRRQRTTVGEREEEEEEGVMEGEEEEGGCTVLQPYLYVHVNPSSIRGACAGCRRVRSDSSAGSTWGKTHLHSAPLPVANGIHLCQAAARREGGPR